MFDMMMMMMMMMRCTLGLVQSEVLRLHVVRPTVRDVSDQDHIGWKSWKL